MSSDEKTSSSPLDWFSNLIGYAAVIDWKPAYREGESRLDLPVYAQIDTYSCGAVAGFQVAKYFHQTAVFSEFYACTSPSPDHGTSTKQLIEALGQYGIRCSRPRRPSLKGIRAAIDAERPVIITIQNTGSDNMHWVTVYGYGDGYMLMATNGLPFFNNHRVDNRKFMQLWHKGCRPDTLVCRRAF